MKIGCDIVYIPRFKKILTRTPSMRRHIFLPQEEKGASMENLAGIFAAKEAAIKALELKAGDWKKIEIVKNKTGRPGVKLESNKHIESLDVSISHDGKYAMAVAAFLIKDFKKI